MLGTILRIFFSYFKMHLIVCPSIIRVFFSWNYFLLFPKDENGVDNGINNKSNFKLRCINQNNTIVCCHFCNHKTAVEIWKVFMYGTYPYKTAIVCER